MVERQRLSFDNVAEILLRTDPLDYETGNPPGAFRARAAMNERTHITTDSRQQRAASPNDVPLNGVGRPPRAEHHPETSDCREDPRARIPPPRASRVCAACRSRAISPHTSNSSPTPAGMIAVGWRAMR